jgi:hypothetical protein
MKTLTLAVLVLLCIFPVNSRSQEKTTLKDEFGKNAGTIEVKKFFAETAIDDTTVLMNPESLLRQIDGVLEYFQKQERNDPAVVNAGIFSQLDITLADVESTLRFIKQVIAEDKKKGGGPSRLQDPRFLREHFRVFRWFPYRRAGTGDKIRITKYAVFTIKGSSKITSVYKYALYSLPTDEAGMSLKEAEKQRHRLCRFKYTKQQVLAGAYDKGGAEPLVWLTRKGLEEALMEGSICVELPNGEKQYFNVDRNNGIAFDRTIKNPKDQKRYWYFGRVKQPQGYGMDIHSQLQIFPDAAFAGDVYNLGLGKVMGISYKDKTDDKQKLRLGILADTGGAFTPNLHQLDYYTGIFASRREFDKKTKNLPGYAEVYFFCLRRPGGAF